MIENLKQLIELSDISSFSKKSMKRFVDFAHEKNNKEKEIFELISTTASISTLLIEQIILLTDEVIVYKVEQNSKDKSSVEAPYRFIYKVDETWKTSNVVCPDFQLCYLSYLQEKHIGQCSDFVYFVNKMLSKNENQ